MRKIYLIRHGRRDGWHSYIGVTDIPLNALGRKEAGILSGYLSEIVKTEPYPPLIFSSPLIRCVETAELATAGLGNPGLSVVDDLHEINLGTWEGKSVDEIRNAFPEEYEKRGKNIGTYKIPGGESFEECGRRFYDAVSEIRKSAGDERELIIFAHAGVIRAFLTLITNGDMNRVMDISLPCASVTTLTEEKGELSICSVGVRPLEMLDDEEMGRLYEKYGVPENIIRHMKAVAANAMDICSEAGLNETLDLQLLRKACLVHDILRMEKDHAHASAEAIKNEGYPEAAAIIEKHHFLEYTEEEAGRPLNEEELLFYADKTAYNDRKVSAEERFLHSRIKCEDDEAKINHNAMYYKTWRIRDKIRGDEFTERKDNT